MVLEWNGLLESELINVTNRNTHFKETFYACWQVFDCSEICKTSTIELDYMQVDVYATCT